MINKAERLLSFTQTFINKVELFKGDLSIARNIDVFFYMQKNEEMRTLIEGILESTIRLQSQTKLLEETYNAVMIRLCKENCWLGDHVGNKYSADAKAAKISIL